MRKVDVATLSHDELKNVVTLLLKENQQLKKQKKYGLVWEETKEKLDNGDIVPLVKEKKDLRIVKDVTKDTNYLIEGDNYHSLLALQKTHLGKIDVIYIDPPYNTGNEFVYNDKIVDKEDNFRHSKWLSFMHKRLKLAKKLLSEDGVIFVSIDDNEQAQLKLLMDEVFGERNFISDIKWRCNPRGRTTSKFIGKVFENVLMYVKNVNDFVIKDARIEDVDKLRDYKFEDDFSKYKKGYPLHNGTKDFHINNRPNLCYAIYYNPETNDTYVVDEKIETVDGDYEIDADKSITDDGFYRIVPKYNEGYDRQRVWRWQMSTFMDKYKTEIMFVKEGTHYYPYSKQRLVGNALYEMNKDFIDGVYTDNGTREMYDLGLQDKFNFPKPVSFCRKLISMHPNKNATVLDFFAGSGTTGHAVMELNKEDGGNRKFILCTNNEVSEEKVRQHFISQGLLDKNNKTAFTKFRQENETLVNQFYKSEEYQKLGIARSVTYERLKRVIEGYTTPKGKFVEGLPNNLTYFQTKELFVDKDIDVTLENSSDVQLYNSLCGSDISIMEEIYDIVKLKQEDANTAVIPIEDVYELPDLTSSEYANKTKFVFLLDDGDIEIMQEQIDVIKSEYPTQHIEFDYTSIYMK